MVVWPQLVRWGGKATLWWSPPKTTTFFDPYLDRTSENTPNVALLQCIDFKDNKCVTRTFFVSNCTASNHLVFISLINIINIVSDRGLKNILPKKIWMRNNSVSNIFWLKGPAHIKNEKLYFLAHAQNKLMQAISVSSESPFRSNLQNNIGPVFFGFFCILLQNGAWHDTKIGCICLDWAGAKKYNFFFATCRPRNLAQKRDVFGTETFLNEKNLIIYFLFQSYAHLWSRKFLATLPDLK